MNPVSPSDQQVVRPIAHAIARIQHPADSRPIADVVVSRLERSPVWWQRPIDLEEVADPYAGVVVEVRKVLGPADCRTDATAASWTWHGACRSCG